MATLKDFIDFLDRKFPNHGETNGNIIKDIQDIHTDIFLRLKRLTNEFKTYEKETVAGQLHYTLPSQMRVENINEVLVSTDTIGTNFETYSYRGIEESNVYGRYYGRATNGLIFIKKNQEAIKTSGFKIHINYFPRPTDFVFVDEDNPTDTELLQVPELDTDFHDLLKFGIVQAMASQGSNPDADIANYWQQEFDEKMILVTREMQDRLLSSPLHISQVKERW